ncbi:hypothetical protein CJU90_5585 [Yarrowia sp. C11]|nr:hypothetical protein CJU90_5585 [Yarrowia sp. C11]KAG5364169.1 hypothetical protein CKK34_2962 [Yarrowia sp. E02]
MSKRAASEVTKKVKKAKATLEMTPEEISNLGTEITKSTTNYNKLSELMPMLKSTDEDVHTAALNSLYNVFRYMAKEDLLLNPDHVVEPKKKDQKTKVPDLNKKAVAEWISPKYETYKKHVLKMLNSSKLANSRLMALEILMRLVKIENKCWSAEGVSWFPTRLLGDIVWAIATCFIDVNLSTLSYFVSEYLDKYDDIRFHVYNESGRLFRLTNIPDNVDQKKLSIRIQELFLHADAAAFPKSNEDISSFWTKKPTSKKDAILHHDTQTLAFQTGWLRILGLPQTNDQYKTVLTVMHQKIIPFLNQPHTTMDFLTQSYNMGGGVALLALNGLFLLMQKQNLEYPDFYTKLYALLDEQVLYASYRSRFFRLLDVFLSSSHLAGAIVASFVKRCSRLALTAPPAAVVTVYPFVYNQLKRHPACMTLLQRHVDGEYEDPFDPEETDPLKTNALESSLWELETVQSHYHPNISKLAKIISEPFRKPQYNMEDFLDHSYESLIDQEMGKNIRNVPAVEFDKFKVFGEGQYMEGWSF